MAAGEVNRTTLASFYQNAGDVYDDAKTEGAFGVLADQIDDNWDDYDTLKSALASTTDGASGADYVKATAVTGLTGGTVQALIEALKAYADNLSMGAVADNAVTTSKIKDANVTNAKVATGIDAAKLADGSVSNTEFQYIGGLTSDAQDQIDDLAKASTSLYRQALINGDFQVWQSGTSFAVPTGGGYTSDMWFARRILGGTGLTVSRQAGDKARYCIQIQRDSGDTSTNIPQIAQLIETANVIPLRGQKLSLSFRARMGADYSEASSLLVARVVSGTAVDGTFTDSSLNITGGSNFISSSFTLTTDWQDFTVSSSSALGDTVNLLEILFKTGAVGTAGTNDWVQIELVGVNVGDTALPVQPRSFGEELRLCQIYYEKSYNYDTAPATASNATGLETKIVASNTIPNLAVYGKISYKVKKRTTPTVTIYPYTTPSNTGRVSNQSGTDLGASSGSVLNNGDDGFVCYNNSGGSVTTLGNCVIFHWTSDARL